MAMTFSTRAIVTLYAQITPGDPLADDGSNYNIGFNGLNLGSLLPTDATKPDMMCSKSFTLGANLTKAFNMETMQIADIDATAPNDPDGNPIEMVKIFAIAMRLLSSSNPAQNAAIKLVNDTWTQPLLLEISQVGGVAFVLWPEGVDVAAGALSNLVETKNDGASVTVDLMVIGKAA
jgi:hypothetical protein